MIEQHRQKDQMIDDRLKNERHNRQIRKCIIDKTDIQTDS